MGWCDSVQNVVRYISPDYPYHGVYERFINITLNWIRFKDYLQQYYTEVPKNDIS